MAVSPDEVRDMVTYQVGALNAFTDRIGVPITHIKPHGALSGMVAEDASLMRPLAELAGRLGIAVLGLPGTAQETEAHRVGVQFIGELYVDLDYDNGGQLIITRPRLADPAEAADRVLSALTTGTIESVDGQMVAVSFESVCVHSDSPNCVEVARAIHQTISSVVNSTAKSER
jgi:UPF0271 protein